MFFCPGFLFIEHIETFLFNIYFGLMRLYLSSYRLGNTPEKFVSMVRGSKKTAVILNARDYFSSEDRETGRVQQIEELNKLGFNAEELDLRNFYKKKGELRKHLEEYDAVWIPGGNSFLLLKAIYSSGFDIIIKELLKEDKIVYAGYSAGIVVLCPTLKGIDIVDDVKYVKEIYNEEPIFEALNILPYSIAPHYNSDHPESELIEKVVEYFEKDKIPYRTLKDGDTIIIDN